MKTDLESRLEFMDGTDENVNILIILLTDCQNPTKFSLLCCLVHKTEIINYFGAGGRAIEPSEG
jgi:hypothetical protein